MLSRSFSRIFVKSSLPSSAIETSCCSHGSHAIPSSGDLGPRVRAEPLNRGPCQTMGYIPGSRMDGVSGAFEVITLGCFVATTIQRVSKLIHDV